MDVALFDLYTEGHHLPYANKLKRALEDVSDHRYTFVTLTETERCRKLFDRSEVSYLDAVESPPVEERDGDFAEIVDGVVSRFASASAEYDVVHFLYADDILGPLWRRWSSAGGPGVVGELNGPFFTRGTVLRKRPAHDLLLGALRSPIGAVIDSAVPDRSSHEALWSDLYLYRCLAAGTFDQLVVHTREAAEYVDRIDTGTTPGSIVPLPAPAGFGTDLPKAHARERLGLPDGTRILLFFGVLRDEKGIDTLLEALRRYRGPEFTVVIAGPPVTVDEADIRETDEASPVEIVSDLRYIHEPEVYYRAADAVVFPYKRGFGKERQSVMFQEVCSSLRPVIAPDFGVLGRYVDERNLGVTFTPGSIESLVSRFAEFATDGIPYSEDHMVRFTDRHSYEQVATDLLRLYEDTRSSEANGRLARSHPS